MPDTMRNIIPTPLQVLLVDDDKDDYLIFQKALDHQVFKTKLDRVSDGDTLMEILRDDNKTLPDVIFLDISMPGKNGYDCLIEIKQVERLEKIPIIMYSTSYQKDVADILFEMGANYYIKKRGAFSEVKNVIEKALVFISENGNHAPTRANFIL